MRIAQSLESPTNVKNTVVIVAQAVLYTARRMAERLIPICSANLIFDVEYKILLIHERHTTTLNGMFSSLTNPHASTRRASKLSALPLCYYSPSQIHRTGIRIDICFCCRQERLCSNKSETGSTSVKDSALADSFHSPHLDAANDVAASSLFL